MESKNVIFSGINQASMLIGGIALVNLIKTILGDGPIELSIENAANIVTFLSSIVIIAKRTFTEIKPLHFIAPNKD